MRSGRVILPMLLVLACCTPNRPYRTTAGVCDAPECRTGSVEVHPVNTLPPTDYRLAVVEFDDQGAAHDAAQTAALVDQIDAQSAIQDLCMVLFVHGWQHNAAWDDIYMQQFRALLDVLTLTESEHPKGAFGRSRKVFGIYAGWRGRSLDISDLSVLSFYDREAAAARVAAGSIRALLGRVRAVRDTLDRTTDTGRLLPAEVPPPAGETLRSTRLLIVGHSFGGLIVHQALAQYFVDRAAASAMAPRLPGTGEADRAIPGYADLVVLVNPAVEAMSWEPLASLVAGRGAAAYARYQRPVLISVTSTADDATGLAFPLARSLGVLTENFTSWPEYQEAIRSAGHYLPFRTHRLTTTDRVLKPEEADANRQAIAQMNPADLQRLLHAQGIAECQAHEAFEAEWRRDGHLRPGWHRDFAAGARLIQTSDAYDANDPFWMVGADPAVIPDHSDITRPVFVDFVRQLYDDLLRDKVGCTAG